MIRRRALDARILAALTAYSAGLLTDDLRDKVGSPSEPRLYAALGRLGRAGLVDVEFIALTDPGQQELHRYRLTGRHGAA